MFGKLFQRFQPTTVEEPIFGRLTNDKWGCWAGRTLFPPLGREIGVVFRLTVTSPPARSIAIFSAALWTIGRRFIKA